MQSKSVDYSFWALNCDRKTLYKIVAECYKQKSLNVRIAELGVCKGKNAIDMFNIFKPEILTMIDPWDSKTLLDGYAPFVDGQLQVGQSELSDFADTYFGGDVKNQLIFDAVYRKLVKHFEEFPHAEFLRETTDRAIEVLLKRDNRYDIIYIDACHQYEHVLRDLLLYVEILSQQGIFILNDYVRSDHDYIENIGVQSALKEFLHRPGNSDFKIIAICDSDVIVARSNTDVCDKLNKIIASSDINAVQLPYFLATHAEIKSSKLSFCGY